MGFLAALLLVAATLVEGKTLNIYLVIYSAIFFLLALLADQEDLAHNKDQTFAIT